MGEIVKHRKTPTTVSRARLAAALLAESNDLVFDLNPVAIGEFKLRARSVRVVGRPTLETWQEAVRFATATHEASPYWIGDLVAYGESRADWKEKLEQAKSITGYAEQSLHNLGHIARKVEEPERQLAPSVAHAAAVAPLERTEQTKWLTKAREERWTVRELRVEIQAASRRKVIDGQAELKGCYRVIVADPPWLYRDNGPVPSGAGGRVSRHYNGMTIEELCKLPVKAHALPNSVLFLWVTAPLLLQNPGPREVIEAWGFSPKGGFVWDKVLGMPGAYNHVTHEHLIIATRGSCTPDVRIPQPKSILVERRSDKHSEKPAEAYRIIEKSYTTGPYLELFASKPREGWSVFGNDARLWATQREQEVRQA